MATDTGARVIYDSNALRRSLRRRWFGQSFPPAVTTSSPPICPAGRAIFGRAVGYDHLRPLLSRSPDLEGGRDLGTPENDVRVVSLGALTLGVRQLVSAHGVSQSLTHSDPQLDDGSIVALGRGVDLMPLSVPKNLGATWEYRVTPFPGLSGGNRAAAVKLQSGALLLCASGEARLSRDGGKTWQHVRKVDGARATCRSRRLRTA